MDSKFAITTLDPAKTTIKVKVGDYEYDMLFSKFLENVAPTIATQNDALLGTNNTLTMSPLKVQQKLFNVNNALEVTGFSGTFDDVYSGTVKYNQTILGGGNRTFTLYNNKIKETSIISFSYKAHTISGTALLLVGGYITFNGEVRFNMFNSEGTLTGFTLFFRIENPE